MNLTVGPLPPAVYWRRRAIVLGAILVVAIFLVAMCNGPGDPSGSGQRKASANQSSAAASGGPTGSTSPVPPIITGSAGAENPVEQPASTAPAPQPRASVDCADQDMSLVATLTPLQVGWTVGLKIKNVSDHACNRDVGPDPQELHVVNVNNQIVWSSDYCQTAHGPDLRTFGPGIEADFTIYWDGRATSAGCVKGAAIPPGGYQLVAKLASKISSPVPFQVPPGK